jgi:hypothetical protein
LNREKVESLKQASESDLSSYEEQTASLNADILLKATTLATKQEQLKRLANQSAEELVRKDDELDTIRNQFSYELSRKEQLIRQL